MDTLDGYVKIMTRTPTVGMWMGKTITITRGEKEGTKKLSNMMKKRHPYMEKKSLVVEKTRTRSLHRRRFLLSCRTLMFKNCFSRRRLPLELLLERN
jgi:putative protein kinase ArgK-like GTPase of G3E family